MKREAHRGKLDFFVAPENWSTESIQRVTEQLFCSLYVPPTHLLQVFQNKPPIAGWMVPKDAVLRLLISVSCTSPSDYRLYIGGKGQTYFRPASQQFTEALLRVHQRVDSNASEEKYPRQRRYDYFVRANRDLIPALKRMNVGSARADIVTLRTEARTIRAYRISRNTIFQLACQNAIASCLHQLIFRKPLGVPGAKASLVPQNSLTHIVSIERRRMMSCK